jgi:hypothetical protein
LLTLALLITFVPVWGQEEEDEVNGLRHRVDRLEALFAELQGTVLELEDPLKPEYVSVDCGAGETVTEALAQAQDHIGPLHITVEGICEEAVHISRDDVTLMGVEPGAGIRAPSGQRAIHLEAVRGIVLSQLTIDASNGNCGISSSDSLLVGMGLIVRGGSICGIGISQGSSATIWNSKIEGGSMFGVKVDGGAAGTIGNSEVRGFDAGTGIYADNGGTIEVHETQVEDNELGIFAFVHANINVWGCVIEGSRNGVTALQNSTISLRDSRIVNNHEHGAHIGAASMLDILDTVVEGNHSHGILVEQASTVTVLNTTIAENGGDGISLRDMSNGLGGWRDGTFITDNGRWGIYCGGPDDGIKTAQNDFAVEDIVFSGNTSGDTNCLGGH